MNSNDRLEEIEDVQPPANDRLLSILVPLYNEAEFIQAVLKRIVIGALPHGLRREIIVADDPFLRRLSPELAGSAGRPVPGIDPADPMSAKSR